MGTRNLYGDVQFNNCVFFSKLNAVYISILVLTGTCSFRIVCLFLETESLYIYFLYMTSELDLEHKQQCPSFLLWGTSSTDSIECICIGVVIEFVRAWYWTHVPVYVASYCCNNLVPNHAWILESICRIIMWVLYLDYGLLLWVIYLCCNFWIQSLWFDLLFSRVSRVLSWHVHGYPFPSSYLIVWISLHWFFSIPYCERSIYVTYIYSN
jgi:hypothetical protein